MDRQGAKLMSSTIEERYLQDIEAAGRPADPDAEFVREVDDLGTLSVSEEVQLADGARQMVLNMGPQHPSTHGVLRVILKLDGEIVTECDPVIGYLHRGTEKLGENHRYAQVIPWTDRTDYVAAPANNLGCALAIEKLCGLEAPERAQYWRVIMAELARISSHLVWLGTHALDIGALSMSLYCFRERELILDLFETFCGARLTTNMMEIGGFSRPIPEHLPRMVRDFINVFPNRQQEYEDLLTGNPIWQARTKGVGVITADAAVSYSLTVACLRGSGVNYDVRKAMPYCVYDRLDFDIPVGTNGDCYDRYLVRVAEMRESTRIIEQCVKWLRANPGPVMIDNYKVAPPSREEMKNDMEALIHHFKLFSEGYSVPAGETYAAIEAPKGELGVYLVSDGANKPFRMHVRAPGFAHLSSMDEIVTGHMLSDVVAMIGTYDVVFGEIDR